MIGTLLKLKSQTLNHYWITLSLEEKKGLEKRHKSKIYVVENLNKMLLLCEECVISLPANFSGFVLFCFFIGLSHIFSVFVGCTQLNCIM